MELSKKGLRRSCSPVPTPGSPSSGPGLEPELSSDTSGRMDTFISKSGGHRLPASCLFLVCGQPFCTGTWAGGKKRGTGPKAKDS